MKITFLVHSLYTIGGTIRTTLNTAEALANKGHEVSLISVFRHRSRSLFDLDERFEISWLIDARTKAEPLTGTDAVLAAKPSRVVPATEPRYSQYTELADVKVAEALQKCDADVIVGTRPGLNVYLAQFAPVGAITVGQEHLFLSHHGRRLTSRLYKTYRKLDALTTVSMTDAAEYRKRMPRIADKVRYIPNSIPRTPLEPSTCESRVIVAAGRLEHVKRYDVLLHAFAKVVDKYPDWQLRIYGHGKQADYLRHLSERLNLYNHVRLMGTRTPIDAEWVKGSIAAVSSDLESFGLTIVEAMDCGLPVVATACPYGPPEIITDGINGILTPPGNVDKFAEALCKLIADSSLRKSISQAAQSAAQRYSPVQVAQEYEDLFNNLLKSKDRQVSKSDPLPTSNDSQVMNRVTCRSVSFRELVLELPSMTQKNDIALARGSTRIPLIPNDSQTIHIDDTVLSQLDEGIWNVQVGDSNALADRIDSRVLVDSCDASAGPVAVPFKDNGDLALRVWHRDVYAEVNDIQIDSSAFIISGTFYGECNASRNVTGTLRLRKNDHMISPPATLDGKNFKVTVAIESLASLYRTGTQLWDLYLDVDDTPIRAGKVFDDLAKRKKVHRLPGHVVAGKSGARRRVQPYFSIDNELSIKISDFIDS